MPLPTIPRCAGLRIFASCWAGSRRPQPGDLASRPEAWIADGEHGWLFDNAEGRLDLSARTLGFDMTALLETPRLRTPVMMYLFHRIEERLDGEPTMILIDEGWKALDDEVFAAAHPRLAEDAAQAQRAGRLRHAIGARCA